jgi:hypothetical protein
MADGFGASVRKRLAGAGVWVRSRELRRGRLIVWVRPCGKGLPGTGVWVRSRELVRGRLMVWVRPCGNGLLDWSLASLSRIGVWMPDSLGSSERKWLAGAGVWVRSRESVCGRLMFGFVRVEVACWTGVWLRSRELAYGCLMVWVRSCGTGLLGLEFGFALANWRVDG